MTNVKCAPLPFSVKAGDLIKFPGVKAVNRLSLEVQSEDRVFVVLRDGFKDEQEITIYPVPRNRGRYKTVSRLPRATDQIVRHGL